MAKGSGLSALVDLLQKQKELLKKAKSRKGQRPPKALHRSRAQLEKEFFTEGLKLQMQGLMYKNQMRTTFVGEAYAPSVAPLYSLKPILLSDLKLETHHSGRVLIVKTFCEPMRISGIHNAVEDAQKNVNRISIHNLPSKISTNEALPKGAIVAVKEPYFKATADGGLMVRVDHPSDYILLDPHDISVPPEWRRGIEAVKTASELKEEANNLFQQGRWKEAGDFYTKALTQSDSNVDFQSTLYRNRAQVHLHLRHYELASDDALAAVIAKDNISHQDKMLNVKSYVRAGRAQYHLRNFILAARYFHRALGLDLAEKIAFNELKRSKKRILEQESGDFDFNAMARSATADHRRLDHATFTKYTMVGSAGSRGRGLFATEHIKRGGLVMVEKAFCVIFQDELGNECSWLLNVNTDRGEFGSHAERLYATIDEIRRNPNKASRLLDLYDGGKFDGQNVSCVENTVVVNTFQVQSIAELNGFACPDIQSGLKDDHDDEGGKSSGIWLHASYMNHSCLPNTSRSFIGDMMIVRATSDIKVGDEILTSYVDPTIEFPRRKEKLSQWGFQCDCPLCQREKKVARSIFATREQLEQETNEFVAANQKTWANLDKPIDATKFAKAKDILRRLEATYDQSLYGDLPRFACVAIDWWLVLADLFDFRTGSSANLNIIALTRLAKHLGYMVNVKGSDASIDGTYGFACDQVVQAAKYSQMAWSSAGRPEVAKAFSELAEEVYLAITGAMEGFDEKFADL